MVQPRFFDDRFLVLLLCFCVLLASTSAHHGDDGCHFDEECQHGGYCDDLHVYDSKCVCPREYSGEFCTEPVGSGGTVDGNALISGGGSQNSARLSNGAIIGICIAGGFFVVFVFAFVMYLARRRKARADIEATGTKAGASLEKTTDGEVVYNEREGSESTDVEEGKQLEIESSDDAWELDVEVV